MDSMYSPPFFAVMFMSLSGEKRFIIYSSMQQGIVLMPGTFNLS